MAAGRGPEQIAACPRARDAEPREGHGKHTESLGAVASAFERWVAVAMGWTSVVDVGDRGGPNEGGDGGPGDHGPTDADEHPTERGICRGCLTKRLGGRRRTDLRGGRRSRERIENHGQLEVGFFLEVELGLERRMPRGENAHDVAARVEGDGSGEQAGVNGSIVDANDRVGGLFGQADTDGGYARLERLDVVGGFSHDLVSAFGAGFPQGGFEAIACGDEFSGVQATQGDVEPDLWGHADVPDRLELGEGIGPAALLFELSCFGKEVASSCELRVAGRARGLCRDGRGKQQDQSQEAGTCETIHGRRG